MMTGKKRRYLTRAEENALAIRARTDRTALDMLVRSQMGLLYHLANRYPQQMFDDVVQAGAIGLMRSVHMYRPEAGNWLTCGWYWASSCMRRFAMFERPIGYRKSQFSRDEVPTTASIDLVRTEGGLTLANVLPDESQDPFAVAEESERSARLCAELEQLPERHRIVIERRLAGRTLQEVGDEFGCSREYVRQLEAAAVKRLRERLSAGQCFGV